MFSRGEGKCLDSCEESALLRHDDEGEERAPVMVLLVELWREQEEEKAAPVLPKKEDEQLGVGEKADPLPSSPLLLSGSIEAPRWMGGRGRALKFLAMSVCLGK